jgi:hypothetical protein
VTASASAIGRRETTARQLKKSIMETDYKKKYEEALNLAQSYYGKGQNEFLDTLFPELAKSEEERIINQLITLVDSTGEILLIPTNKEELIAWLEKQKEQKDYRNLYEGIAKSEWFKKAYEGKSLGSDDEQKEQKPVELSDDELERYFDYKWYGENLSFDFDKIPSGWVSIN